MANGLISGRSNVTKDYVDEKIGTGILRSAEIEKDDFYGQLIAKTLEDAFYKVDYDGSELVKYAASQTSNSYAGANDSMCAQNGVIYMGSGTFTYSTDAQKISCVDTATNTETIFDTGLQSSWGTCSMAQAADGTIYIPPTSYTSGTSTDAYKKMVVVHNGAISVMNLPIFTVTSANPDVFYGLFNSHVVHGNSVYFFPAYTSSASQSTTHPILKATTQNGSVEFSYIDLTPFARTFTNTQWGCENSPYPTAFENYTLAKYVLARDDGMYVGQSGSTTFLYLDFSDDSVVQVTLPSSLTITSGGTFMSSDGHLFVGSTTFSNANLVEYDGQNLINSFVLPANRCLIGSNASRLKCGGGSTKNAVFCFTYSTAANNTSVLKIKGSTCEIVSGSEINYVSSGFILTVETSDYMVFRPNAASYGNYTYIINKNTENVSFFDTNELKDPQTNYAYLITNSCFEFGNSDAYCAIHSYVGGAKGSIVMGKISDNEIQIVGERVPEWAFLTTCGIPFAYKIKKDDKYFVAFVTRDTNFSYGPSFGTGQNLGIRYVYSAENFGFFSDELKFPLTGMNYFMTEKALIYLQKNGSQAENGLFYISTNKQKTKLEFVVNNKIMQSFGEI
jgi:hypothetical protein